MKLYIYEKAVIDFYNSYKTIFEGYIVYCYAVC